MSLKKKTKIESKTTSKNNKTEKDLRQKKESNVDKQECTCPVCKGVSKESRVDWFVCRTYVMCGHENFIPGIRNTWFEIIHIKNRTR